MPASFNAWVGSPRRDDPLLEATATTLAVA
jgi:hypothetical protein